MNSDSLSPRVPRIPGLKDSLPGAAYKKGDLIGQKYEVAGVLGAGGFGIVYLVYSHETKNVYALKTFRDEYVADAPARERFRKEASVWMDMERHPYLVRAYFVNEVGGRLFIAMEYIAPGEDGLNTLEGYLQHRPPDLAQSLRWAIQFCHGIEYAYSKGIRCHRDIKPANIMISQDSTVKITDFGLAGVLGAAQGVSGIKLNIQQGTVGPTGQTVEGTGFGTPPYMSPEQFTDAASCDERSDIYSFGVVLFQMASGGRLPFLAAPSTQRWTEMHRLHARAPVPKLNSPLFPIIQRCMEKETDKRYQSFRVLRRDVEPLLKRLTGGIVTLPESGALEAWEWGNKGVSLDSLGRYEEAVHCFDRALELDPRLAITWNNKGIGLGHLGQDEEAVHCYDKALELDPRLAVAWYNKGGSLHNLSRDEEAIRCYGMALELDPRLAAAWYNKGNVLNRLGRYDEALSCSNKVLELDPLDAAAWRGKGLSLKGLGRYEEAIRCYDKALELVPRDDGAWNNKGICLGALGRHEEAIHCFDAALELDSRDTATWLNKGRALDDLGRHEEAVRCYDKALDLDPRNTAAWGNKAESLGDLGRFEEAIRCIDKVLELGPRNANAWCAKALAQEGLGRRENAVASYRQFIALAPAEHAKQIALAQQRIRELEGP